MLTTEVVDTTAAPVVRTTTLAKIREFGPCSNGWAKLLKHLGKTEADDEPLLMSTILESNGLDDAIWALRAFHGEHRLAMINFACDCVERVLPIWEAWAEKNAQDHLRAPRKAIEIIRRKDESTESAHAAHAAAVVAAAADTDAAFDASASAVAACAAAADTAACAVAACAANADDADAARDAELEEQKKLLLKYFG